MGFFSNIQAAAAAAAAKKTPAQLKAQHLASTTGLSTPSSFHVSGSMSEVAKLQPGLTNLSGRLNGIDVGSDVLLYDEATGSVYRTNNWKDATRNNTSLVGSSGQRQQVASVGQKTKDGNTEMTLGRAGAGPANVDIIFGLDEAPPTPGTDEFQSWLQKQFDAGVQTQAASHMYDPDKKTTGTGYGGFGGISWSDWVEMGRPDKIGNDSLALSDEDKQRLSEMSDEQVSGLSGFLMTRDVEQRHKGVVKALDSVGGKIGWKSMASDTLRTAGAMGAVPVVGTTLRLAASAAAGYDQGGWKGAGKATLETSVDMSIEAAAAALVGLSAGTLAPVVGGGLLAGIGTGAVVGGISGGASSLAASGVHSTIWGGYDEGSMWNSAGRATVVGAAAGAVAGGLAAKLPANASTFNAVVDRAARGGTAMALSNYASGGKQDTLGYILAGVQGAASSNPYGDAFGGSAIYFDNGRMTHEYTDKVRRTFMDNMANSVPLFGAAYNANKWNERRVLQRRYGATPAQSEDLRILAQQNDVSIGTVGDWFTAYGSVRGIQRADTQVQRASGGSLIDVSSKPQYAWAADYENEVARLHGLSLYPSYISDTLEPGQLRADGLRLPLVWPGTRAP